MSYRETVKQIRAIQQRIKEKKYPMLNIGIPSSLSPGHTKTVLKKYQEYEKRMDEMAALFKKNGKSGR